MKARRPKAGRRDRARRRRFMLEPLEPRVVLDGQLGAEVAQVANDAAAFEQFESADELRQYLVEAAVDRWKDVFGTTIKRWPYIPYILEDTSFHSAPPRTAGGAENQPAGQFDGTNVQVNGVDEADLVKTDGEYLYVANEGRLSIIDARNPAELSLAAEIPFDSHAGELYVSGDRLVLLSNQYGIVPHDLVDFRDLWWPDDSYGPQTSVAIYDIADRTSPELVQRTTFDGTLTTSRRIDDIVYLVTSDTLGLPRPETDCRPIVLDDPHAPAEAEGFVADAPEFLPPDWPRFPHESCVYETKEAYLARVTDSLIELAMPSFETTDAEGDVIASGLISEPTGTYKPLADAANTVTSIVVIDLSTEASGISATTSLITDYSSTVYASAHNIYVAANSSDGEGHTSTTLQQFAIGNDGTTVDLAAVGTVPGFLLNQFAMDEHDGHLRVVTSTGWGPDRTNQLFVLEQLGTSLDVVGSIDEIATGEAVFAVRFVGDEAFVITFRVIDPLFTIDLSDPAHPTIAGELKIPGFSNYLHPISADFVLGLGRDGSDLWGSPQLSLFDVSDFSQPERVDNYVFRGASWSPAFYDHHAINYFPDSQIAVIPFQGSFGRCHNAAAVVGCSQRQANAFWVIQVNTASGDESLQLLGTIEHEDAPLRSLRIGENLFTVAASSVKVTDLLHPKRLIDALHFGQIAFNDYVRVVSHEREVELDVLGNDHVVDSATIVAVTASDVGAVVEISAAGKSLLYTPAANSDVENDSFEYAVESGGRRDSATVQVFIHRENVTDRMIRLAKTHLLERLGLQDSPLQVETSWITEREWPDSCLGVANDGEVCAQVITPGFEIVFEYSLTRFVYHTDTTERVVPANDPVIETQDLIQLRAEIVNADGKLITSLLIGEEATLRIHAEDLRDDPLGVYAAYFDVLFDPARDVEFGPITFGAEFSHATSGSIDENGLIDELGGYKGTAGPIDTLVVSIPIIAASPGELRFTLEAPDDFPAHDLLLLGINSAIPSDRIRFGDVAVEVIDSMHNEAHPMDTNMDGQMTPLDALIVINHIERHGAGPVNAGAIRALRAAAAEARAFRFAADVNGDGYISPIDVLMIVNAFKKGSEVLAEGEAVASELPAVTLSSVSPVPLTSGAEPRPASSKPATRAAVALPPIAASESVPVAMLLDDLAHAVSQHESTQYSSSCEDTFFADLATGASAEWWRG